jgi:hypothetical protein
VDAEPLAGPLVLLAPTESPTPAELAALVGWVRRGGTLLYVARPEDATLGALGLALAPAAREVEAVPTLHRLTTAIPPVPQLRWVFADSSPALDAPGMSPLLITGTSGIAVVEYGMGNGRVVAWSDPEPLRNRSLREGGAPLLFARIARDAVAGGDTLRFDEYHHGYRSGGSAAAGTLRFVGRTPLGHTTLQLALVGLGTLLLLGRRFGAPHHPPPAQRRSPLEHVGALAEAYRRAGARRVARRLLIAGLARQTGQRVPQLPAGMDGLVELAHEIDTLLSERKRT